MQRASKGCGEDDAVAQPHLDDVEGAAPERNREPIVPAALGDPTVWVLITGVIEIAIGIGLIIPQTRWYAGWTSAAFLVAVYWANLNMWVNDLPIGGQSYADIWHVLRLVAQIGMIGLSLAIAMPLSAIRGEMMLARNGMNFSHGAKNSRHSEAGNPSSGLTNIALTKRI